MKSLLSLGVGFPVLILTLVLVAGGCQWSTTAPAGLVGYEAHAFSGTDREGNRINLEDLRGRVVVVDFWATWCGPCVRKIPELVEIQRDYSSRGLQVVGVSVDQAEADLRRFEEQRELNFPSIHDSGGRIANQYGIQFIPTIVLIDREGVVRAVGPSRNFRQEIEKVL